MSLVVSRGEFNREDVEQAQHFRRQQAQTGQDDQNSQNFADGHAALASGRVKAARDEGQNVDGGKTKYQHPEDVVKLAPADRELPSQKNDKKTRGTQVG